MNRHHPLRAGAALLGLACAGLPATAQTAASESAAARPYVLSPDDQIDITVLGHEDLKASVAILPDGTFRYPIVGTVHAAGLTVEGLTRALARGLSDQLNQPQVTVTVTQSRPRKVSILGAVKSPGQYDVRPGTHLLDVLAACGGPAQAPELTQATLVMAGGKQSVAVDMPGLLAGTDAAQNLPLAPGDVLLVQPRDPALAQAQVMGEVAKPGAFDIPADGVPALTLLNDAGGATPKAALSRAQILHAGRTQTLNLRPLMSRLDDAAGSVRVMPGDVLLLPENTAKVAVLGEVRAPAAYDLPDGGALSVTDAVALAGGATAEGDKKNATILRRDGADKPTLIAVNLDDLMRGKGAPDTALQPGDILYVPTRKQGGGFNVMNLLSLLPFMSVLRR
ncbi:MAG: SLBB domain-containing protein [Armatimonadetes bacterium]|nr:SLBB domain-containing protein [Armatimonadota bacterium]